MRDGGGYPPPAPTSSTVRVNKENVLQAAAAFQAEADRMLKQIDLRRSEMRFEPALGDPASTDVAQVLKLKLANGDESYIERALQYVDELQSTAQQLTEAAKSYGYTDEDIASALSAQGDPRA
ncbi:hypothetical protein GCM10012275_40050 [Longimycelium tulufanense]|uniref:Uncharacterized protein n=2 Tax=Longimycelium tulufanense TaxID=907463 RepID=A0A8J3CE15_9PSEU|nr:hypothetical protein GCM10012275_40050 [Longimycelium tulufanense]